MRILNSGIDLRAFFARVPQGALLVLDYDGTLAPFVKERMHAYPYNNVKKRLLTLKEIKTTRMVIVSGRKLSDLEKLLDIPGLELWGSHGLERKLSSGESRSVTLSDAHAKDLETGIKIGQELVAQKHIEVKPYGVAVHSRAMSKEEFPALLLVEERWKENCTGDSLEVHHFDGGIELRPRVGNKGAVIKTLLNEAAESDVIAYLGDDLTDEDAFAALGTRGLKILVRPRFRQTLADIYLIPPNELTKFLDGWIGGGW